MLQFKSSVVNGSDGVRFISGASGGIFSIVISAESELPQLVPS